MADNISGGPDGAPDQETTGVAVRLVRGSASPEELAALLAILASLGDEHAEEAGSHTSCGWRPQSQWHSHRRMVRPAHSHGPGGWRASGLSR
jgi:hypothetical protein